MKVEAMTSRLASRFSLRFEKGLVVSSVKRGGPAERGGVRVGDQIKEINHIPVRTHSEFQKEMGRSRSRGSVLFLLRRRKTEVFAAVRFP
jgi:serine protease Do